MPKRRRVHGFRSSAYWRRPSLAVLPFDGFGHGIIQRYFTEGFSGDVSECISRMADIRVIPPSSTLQFSGTRIDAGRVGQELGASYVLTGHIILHGQDLTFSQRLFESRTGKLRWTDVVRVGIDDLFDVQRRIVQRVANGILPQVTEAEIEQALAKLPNSLDAYDLTLRALPAIRSLNRSGIDESLDYLKRAMSMEPEYAAPHAWAARLYSLRCGQSWATDREGDGHAAIHHAEEAIKRDPCSSLALAVSGHLRSFLRQEYDEGMALLERAVEVCPSDPLAWAMSGATLAYVGRAAEAVERTLFALRLSPMDLLSYQLNFYAGLAFYAAGRYDEAVSFARLSLAENPRFVACHKLLAVALAGTGAIESARAAAKELDRLAPGLARVDGQRNVFRDPGLHQRFAQHLSDAGITGMPSGHVAPLR